MASHISPVVLRQEIGRRIRLARQDAGMTIIDAAHRLEISKSGLNRVEKGVTTLSVHLTRSMMDVYDQRLDDVVEMVRQARAKGWWKQYGTSDRAFIALETGASRSSNYELTYVPGLLQTAHYARALFESNHTKRPREWVDSRVAVRLYRQERLTDDQDPIELDAVVHEFALRTPVGGAVVMRNQLRQLALISELPTVTLRVMASTVVSHEAMVGGFTILDFPGGHPSISHVNHALGDDQTDESELVETASTAAALCWSWLVGGFD